MSYCTASDVKEIKSVKRLLAPDGNWEDSDITDRISEISASEIDLRLAGWYEVPLSPVPDIIKRICKLLVAYEMLMEEFGQSDGNYDYLKREADYLLEGIENRRILLETSDSAEYPNGGPKLVISDENRYFG